MKHCKIVLLLTILFLLPYKLTAKYTFWTNIFDSFGSTATINSDYCITAGGQGIIGNSVKGNIDVGIGFIYSLFIDTVPPVTATEFSGDYYETEDNKYVSTRTSFTLSAYDPVIAGWSTGVDYTKYKIDDNVLKIYEVPVIVSSEIPENEWEGEHTLKYYSVDNAGNEEEIKEDTVLMDIKPPEDWSNFTPADWVIDWIPDCSIEVADLVSGLDVNSAEYKYSIDTGQTWSEWIEASCTGINGSTETQTITAFNVPFNQASVDKNKIMCRISDMVNNVGISPVYTVKTMIPAVVDIDPNTLNMKSRGRWITCYIEFPEGYDIKDINLSTLNISKINGGEITPIFAESAPTNIGDHDMDGIPDLMVKFNRSAVQNVVSPAEQVKLTIEGFLIGGTKLIGTDTIRVINPPFEKVNRMRETVHNRQEGEKNNKPDKLGKQEKTNQGKHIGSQAKNHDKGLFPKKLKFRNGHKWAEGPKNILNVDGEYPDWQKKWKNENKKRNQKFELGWAKEKKVKINKLMDQPDISVSCLAVYDAETGELIWHSNYGSHNGKIMDLRNEYKKNSKMNGLLKIKIKGKDREKVPGKDKGKMVNGKDKSDDKSNNENDKEKGKDKNNGDSDDKSNNGNKNNDNNNGKGEDNGKGKGKNK